MQKSRRKNLLVCVENYNCFGPWYARERARDESERVLRDQVIKNFVQGAKESCKVCKKFYAGDCHS